MEGRRKGGGREGRREDGRTKGGGREERRTKGGEETVRE